MNQVQPREDTFPAFALARYLCVDCRGMFSRNQVFRLRYVGTGRSVNGGHWGSEYRCSRCHDAYWRAQAQ